MENVEEKGKLKRILNYFSNVISWTIFSIFVVIGILLLYYYISVNLYARKGDKYEPFFSVYTIVSQSMEPTISVYDVIVNTKINDIKDVKINDVITFISTWEITKGMTITHRVVGEKTLDDGSRCLITRGDNNTQEDQTCVKKENIIGVTKAVIPKLGKLQAFLANRFAWLLVVIVPSIIIIIKDVLRLLKLSKEVKGEAKE